MEPFIDYVRRQDGKNGASHNEYLWWNKEYGDIVSEISGWKLVPEKGAGRKKHAILH